MTAIDTGADPVCCTFVEQTQSQMQIQCVAHESNTDVDLAAVQCARQRQM